MFEQIVTTVLNKVLSDFIDDVTAKQLNIGLWGGTKFIYSFLFIDVF